MLSSNRLFFALARRNLSRLWLLLPLLVVTALVSAAEPEGKSPIERAYQRTNTAKTVDDYSEIIGLCEEARREQLTAEQAEYVKSLLAWSHNRRGEMFTEQATQSQDSGKTDQARVLDAKALADFEASLEYDNTRWKTWHNRAISQAISGKYEEAIRDFSKVIELKPDYTNAWFNRGEIQYDLGRVAEAIEDYTQAIKLDPTDAGAFASRGHAHFRLGQAELALADYSRAIELAPQNAEMLANRGEAYQNLGKWKEAATDFLAAVQLSQDSPRVFQATAWFFSTCPDPAVREQGGPELTVAAAEKALTMLQQAGQPVDVRYLDTLAAAYANAGSFEKAVAKISEAMQTATTDQSEILKKRLETYRKQQPYRQGVGERTASAAKAKKRG